MCVNTTHIHHIPIPADICPLSLSRVMGIVVFNPGSRLHAVARQLGY